MKKYMALFLAVLLMISCVPALASEPSLEPDPAPSAPVTQTSTVLSSLEPPRCKAAVVMDAGLGEVLYDFHGGETNYPASITKVMTALLTLEAADRGEVKLDETVTASDTFSEDLSEYGSTQNIKEGEELSVRELLYCALVASANEACNILAQRVAGDIPSFVAQMNRRAGELGMTGTHFMNAHGLQDPNHYTTAYDIALLVREALGNDVFAEIVRTKSHTVPETNLSRRRTFVNTNALITGAKIPGYTYANAIGVKTGSTSDAGQCLASAAREGDRTVICVVLGAENEKQEDGTVIRHAFAESKRLLEWGLENFRVHTLISTRQPVKEIPVTLSADTTAVALKPQEGLERVLPVDIDADQLERVITTYYESVEAPVTAGQILGEMTVKNGTEVYGSVKLVATTAVERNELLWQMEQVKRFFGQGWVKISLAVLGVAIALLILRFSVFKPQKGYHGRKRK